MSVQIIYVGGAMMLPNDTIFVENTMIKNSIRAAEMTDRVRTQATAEMRATAEGKLNVPKELKKTMRAAQA